MMFITPSSGWAPELKILGNIFIHSFGNYSLEHLPRAKHGDPEAPMDPTFERINNNRGRGNSLPPLHRKIWRNLSTGARQPWWPKEATFWDPDAPVLGPLDPAPYNSYVLQAPTHKSPDRLS